MDRQSADAVPEDLPAVARANPSDGPEPELPRAGFFAQVMQATPRHFSRLPIPDAALILVRAGRKTATCGPVTVSAGPGEIVAIAGGEAIDLINYGPTDDQPYRADVLGFNDSLIADVTPNLPPNCRRAGLFAFKSPPGFDAAAMAAREALDPASDLPPEVARHRFAELLVWVARGGVFFSPRREVTMVTRVRELVRSDLTRDWSAAEVAAELGLSEATLRRRLRNTGFSLTSAIGDARMAAGLGILQTSALSVDRVALEVGYASASKFARRFRARFGLLPSEIRRVRA